MVGPRKMVQPELPLYVAERAPQLKLIGQEDADRGLLLCLTCGKGMHTLTDRPQEWGRFDLDGQWTVCNACGARPYNNAQIDDVKTIMEHDGQALLAACLGARKTGTSVLLMNQLKGVWVVVCPKHTMAQWQAAVAEWAPTADVHLMTVKNKTDLIDLKEDRGPFSIHIIGWERFRARAFDKYKFLDGIILDEVHRMAGSGSASAKAVWKCNTKWRVGLSGTPANNKLWGLFNILHFIWWGNKDHKNANIFRRFKLWRGDDDNPGWVARHFELSPDPFGNQWSFIIGKEKQLHSVISEIPCYIQHLEHETCCQWHPGGVNANIRSDPPRNLYVEMTPAQRKLYDQVANGKPVMWLDDETGQLSPIAIASGGVRDVRLQQIALAVPSTVDVVGPDGVTVKAVTMSEDAASASIEMLIDLLVDIVEPGVDPVLVFTHSKIFAKIVVKRLRALREIDFPVAEWTGDTKQDDREKIKDWFGREGGPQVIVASIPSIAEGTDGLQVNGRREVWLSEVYGNVTLNTQAAGRLPRTGQKRTTQRWNIVVKDSILETIIDYNEDVKDTLDLSLRAPTVLL